MPLKLASSKKRRGAENVSLIRDKQGRVIRAARMRDVAHAKLDKIANDVIRNGGRIQGYTVVLAFRDKDDMSDARFASTHSGDREMVQAVEMAAFKLRLEQWLTIDED